MKTIVLCALLSIVSVPPLHAGPLTLQEALSRRSAASRVLKIAAIDEQIAIDNVTSNRSGYLPRLDIQGGYTAQQAPQSVSVPFGSFETQQPDFAFASLGITQTLYNFGKTDARYTRAQTLRDATRLDYTTREQDLFLQTATAYFRILQLQKLLKAADDEVTQMTDHLRMAKALFEGGVITRNNVLQAEVQLARSRQHRLETANRLDNAWLDLNDQFGDPPDSRRELVEETAIDIGALDKPAQEATAKRAELLALRKLFEASGQEITETRTGYFPELYAKLGLDYVQNNRVKEQTIMAATVGLKVNLFEGFATDARLQQAVKARSRTAERIRQLEADLALEYRVAVNDAKVARERIAVAEASIRQGEENLRINKERFQEKMGTATDVIDAQTLLTQIRTDYYQANFDYQIALARVKRARGEL